MHLLVSGWFSYSHWGMFMLPLLSAPDWFVDGMIDLDDDLISEHAD